MYAGIKKAVLDSYLNMLNQLNIKVVAVEYSAFSILRFLQLNTPISNRGIVGVISADLQEEDEVHFTIMENGFPLFSRDITLRSISEKAEAAEKLESGMLQEKLKTEVRISLDYYNRKLPTKGIEKVFIVASESYRSILETVAKEIGLPLVAMGTNPYLSSTASLGLVKGYGSSLYRAIRTKLKIDLLASKTKGRAAQEAPAAIDIGVILRGFKVSPLAFIAGIAMVGAAVGYGQFQIGPLNRDRNLLVAARPPVKAVKPDATVQEL